MTAKTPFVSLTRASFSAFEQNERGVIRDEAIAVKTQLFQRLRVLSIGLDYDQSPMEESV
jgi:hypothetical protein